MQGLPAALSRPSRASRKRALAPTVILAVHRFCIHHIKPVGAGLPAMAVCQPPSMLNEPASSRASPLPQWFWVFANFAYTHQTCGSGLARDGGVSGNIDFDCAGLIAGKPAPTVVLGVRKFCIHPPDLWERACPRWRCAAWAQPILANSSATMATVWVICSSVCSHETKKRTRATCSGTAG